jgi:dihydrofolate reductase
MPSWCEATWGERFSSEGLYVGGVTLPLALADLGLIDEYEFLVQPVLAGHGPTLLSGLRERIQLELVSRHEFRSGAVALRYRPVRAAV